MSAGVAAAPRAAVRESGLPVWATLGAAELRRLVLSPLLLAGLAFLTVVASLDAPGGPRDAYFAVTGVTVFWIGPFTFFAANLLASRARRHGTEDWLSSLPAGRRDRTAADLVACAGPAVVVAAGTAVALSFYVAADAFVRTPAPLELLTGPLGVLGGGLLGVMVARWARFPGAALLVMVGLVATHMSLSDRWVLLGAYVEFARWGETSTEWAGVIDGSRGWHAAYLAGLCGMATIGALLADVRRKLPVFLLGVAVTAFTALAGWAQLP